MIKRFWGNTKAFINYCRTQKGKHDLIDYSRALLIIFVTILLVYAFIIVIVKNN